MPTIAVRDLEIQRRESDLVVGTFGRGIFILDDYSSLRNLTKPIAEKPAAVLPVKKALLYIPAAPRAEGGKAYQGASFYTAPNPPFGATITYHLKEALKTKKAARREQEQKLERESRDVFYPGWDTLKTEDREDPPAVILTIRNATGQIVRRLAGPGASGLHRIAWDLRWPSYQRRLEPGCQHQADHRPDADLTPQDARSLELKLLDVREQFTGDPTRSRRNEPAQVGLIERIEIIIGGHWSTTSAPTGSHRKNYEIAAAEFEAALKNLHPLLDRDLPALHETLEAAGAPWAPGRKLPQWKR